MLCRTVGAAFLCAAVLAACGGGGGGGGGSATTTQPPAQPPSGNPPSGSPPASSPPSSPSGKTWKTTTVHSPGLVLSELIAGPLPSPGVEWFSSGASLSAGGSDFVEGSGWQDRGISISVNPPTGASISQIARAGGWTVITWTGFTTHSEAYAEITGPNGFDSGVLTVSGAGGIRGGLRVAVAANGDAVFAWREVLLTSRRFTAATGLLPPTTHGPGPHFNFEFTPIGRDGSGWLFYSTQVIFNASDHFNHWAAQIDPVTGLGTPFALDDPTLTPGEWPLIQAVLEDAGKVTAIWGQNDPDSCVATRRFDGSSWGPATCVNGSSPRPAVGFQFRLAGNGSGRMVAVWPHDTGVVRAAIRSAAGVWGAPAQVTTAQAPYVFFGSDRVVIMSGTGRAMVLSRARSTDPAVVPAINVVTAEPDGTWGSPITFDLPASGTLGIFNGAFDSSDAPAVLWSKADATDTDTIHFRRRGSAGWESTLTVRANVHLLSAIISGVRVFAGALSLVPRPNENWLAIWDDGTAGVVGADYD